MYFVACHHVDTNKDGAIEDAGRLFRYSVDPNQVGTSSLDHPSDLLK
jgi:hypothetical protein